MSLAVRRKSKELWIQNWKRVRNREQRIKLQAIARMLEIKRAKVRFYIVFIIEYRYNEIEKFIDIR